jgi:hypothetical protein
LTDLGPPLPTMLQPLREYLFVSVGLFLATFAFLVLVLHLCDIPLIRCHRRPCKWIKRTINRL